jgi:hypothetical protein
MAVRPNLYRANAKECAGRAERSHDQFVRAAYRELIRAWLILADSAEQLASTKPVPPVQLPTAHRKAA